MCQVPGTGPGSVGGGLPEDGRTFLPPLKTGSPPILCDRDKIQAKRILLVKGGQSTAMTVRADAPGSPLSMASAHPCSQTQRVPSV